jgi:hypothetical protein
MGRVRITNNSLNSYGTRVLTEGLNIDQYERNPVLLWMHERGNVIGYARDIKKEGDSVTCELVFDEVTELSKQLKCQFEKGSIRMTSIGIDILELSNSPELLVPGQTCPTITKSKLNEVSLVDIGANNDAIRLTRNGKVLTCGAGGSNALPLLETQNKKEEMEQKILAIKLGLPETADENAINAKITELQNGGAQTVAELKKQVEELTKAKETLEAEKATMESAGIEKMVDAAISGKKLTADKKAEFISLGAKIGSDDLEKLLNGMQPSVKLSQVIGHQGGEATGAMKLGDLSPEEQVQLKKDDMKQYRVLYEKEYGVKCPV